MQGVKRNPTFGSVNATIKTVEYVVTECKFSESH